MKYKIILVLSILICTSFACYGEDLNCQHASDKLNLQITDSNSAAIKANKANAAYTVSKQGLTSDSSLLFMYNALMISRGSDNSPDYKELQKKQQEYIQLRIGEEQKQNKDKK